MALFDNGILQLPSFGGLPVDPNSLLVAIAHLGDANGNGIVDIQDQSIVTNHWQTARAHWDTGDLNRDGFVDLQDLTLVTNNWQQSSTFSLSVAQSPSAVSSIPEPTSLLLLLPALLLRPRHRRQSKTGVATQAL